MAPLAVSGHVLRASFWVRSQLYLLPLMSPPMPPGPEKGPAVHDEDQHRAERADDQPDQPGHRGVPREAAGGRGGR